MLDHWKAGRVGSRKYSILGALASTESQGEPVGKNKEDRTKEKSLALGSKRGDIGKQNCDPIHSIEVFKDLEIGRS